MKNKSLVYQLISKTLLTTLLALSLWGCNGSGGSNTGQDSRQLDRTLVNGQTCTPAVGAPGTRITCPADMARVDGCNIMFDTQPVPRGTITYNADRTVSFVIPPASTGLYKIKKICGAQQVDVAQEQVNGIAPSVGARVPAGSSEFAECAAGGNQCQIGQVCRSNHCVASCNSTYDCPGGQICRDQQCVANSNPECDDDPLHTTLKCTGAKSGLVCVHGACEPCRDNLACGNKGPDFTGFVCSASNINSSLGLCQACQTTSQCSAGQACVMDSRAVGRCGACTLNSQCGDGNICNVRTGQCTNNGVASNAAVNVVVSEVPGVLGLLRIDWDVRGIQASAIRDAYVYGPFGIDGCNNILMTAENVVSSDPQFRNGTACEGQVVNGQSVCRSVDAGVLWASSVGTNPDAAAGATPTPTTIPDTTRPTGGVLPTPGSVRPGSVFMTCRVPMRNILTKTIYTTMKVSPSAFRAVVQTVDNQVFAGEGRFVSGGVDLRVDDVQVSATSPLFTIQGTYSRTEDVPTFEGCVGGTYSSDAHSGATDSVRFTKTCAFDISHVSALPQVIMRLQGSITGDSVEHTLTFNDCFYDEEDTSFDYGDVYASNGSVCATRDAISSREGQIISEGVATCTSGQLQLTSRIRRACYVQIDSDRLSETPESIPWFVQFMVHQTNASGRCVETTHPITVTGSSAALSIGTDGQITYRNRLTRDLSCNEYLMEVFGGPVKTVSVPIYIDRPGVRVVKNNSETRWFYDYVIADTNCDYSSIFGCTDVQYCTKDGGIAGASGVWVHLGDYDNPQRYSNVQLGSPDGLSCGPGFSGNFHDSNDGVAGCSKYNGNISFNILTKGATSHTVGCCAYGEWSHGGSEPDPRLDGRSGTYGEGNSSLCARGGRYYEWTSGTTPLVNSTGGEVSTAYNRTVYGETVRCAAFANGGTITGDQRYTFFDFSRPIGSGRCDSPDREHSDDNDADTTDMPSIGGGYPSILPAGTAYPTGIRTGF